MALGEVLAFLGDEVLDVGTYDDKPVGLSGLRRSGRQGGAGWPAPTAAC